MIAFEWALEGKPPGGYDDYGLLAWSEGRLDFKVFDELRSRYAAGTSADLPQVTIATARTAENGQISHHVVLAIREWSEHRDFTNRKIAYTRWFYVPYEQLVENRVSYTALYDAFAALPPRPEPPLTVDVPPYDPEAVSPGQDALSAAALLLGGRQVCVIGADNIPMAERLRFVDTVAALLPYGMRTRFTAATWTSGTTEHRIKLSFARDVPEGTHAVVWGRGARIPHDEVQARLCHDMYVRPDAPLPGMIGRLARQTVPLSFAPDDRPQVLRLLEQSGYAAPKIEPAPAPAPARESRVEPSKPAQPSTSSPRAAAEPAETTVAYRHGGGYDLDRLAEALAHAAAFEAEAGVEGLARAAADPAKRPHLQRLLLRHHFFKDAIERHPDKSRLYERLADAAFPPGDLKQQDTFLYVHDLIVSEATPEIVKAKLRRILEGRRERGRWDWRAVDRKVVLLGGAAALVAVSVTAVFLFLTRAGESPSAVYSPPPQTVVVQAPADRQYAAQAFAEMLRREGYAPTVETIDPATAPPPPGTPAVTVAYDLDVLEAVSGGPPPAGDVRGELQSKGLIQVADLGVTSSDVLLVRDGVKPDKFFDHRGEVLVRDTFGARARDALTGKGLPLALVPAQEVARRLADQTAEAAIVPESQSAVPGYRRAVLEGVPLPQRKLVALATVALDDSVRSSLSQVAAIGDLARTPTGDTARAARTLVDRIIPAEEPAEEPAPAESFPWILFAVVVAIGFAAVVLLMWRPSRSPTPLGHHRRR